MNPQEAVFVCTCELFAHYEQSYAGDGVSVARIDVYRCASGHMVQVIYPGLVTVTHQRLKPVEPPRFPGSW